MKHGGDISRAMAEFGDGPGQAWLDLSTGIAPEPYPLPEIPYSVWQQLPQHGDYAGLLKAARSAYSAAEDCPIIAAPGTQLLIQLLPLLRPDADVRVLGPTYSEHAICWRRTARQVSTVASIEALHDADVAIVTNPNNPDGRVLAPEVLCELAARLADRGRLLIVDEAFADVDPGISCVPHAGRPGLLILRSFGKFFGLAGVRLGFALGVDKEISALDQLLGPWAVPGPALFVGERALRDSHWATAARRRYQEQSQQLDVVLSNFGFELVGGTSLFRLFAHEQAATLHRQLAHAGILTRVFESEPTWMRFGLPGKPENFRRLEQCLQRVQRPAAAK